MNDPAWWTWEPDAEDREFAEQQASHNPGSMTAASALSDMRWCKAFRAYNDAQNAWLAEHGFVDERGRVDWHRVSPLIRAGAE